MISKTRLMIILAVATGLVIASSLVYVLQQPIFPQSSDFTLRHVDGAQFSLHDFRGRVVVLDFMSLPCGLCDDEVEELKRVYKVYGDRVTIISIGVNPFDTEGDLLNYATQKGMEWIVAKDTGDVAHNYRITTLPALVIIDQQGNIRARYVGLISAATLIQELDRLITQPRL